MDDAVEDQLLLARELTARTGQLCRGLAAGDADILELVTPVTAELLRWWFGAAACAARAGPNFRAGQRQAILNTIVAHEVFQTTALEVLYERVLPAARITGARRGEVAQPQHAHPKYCLKMAAGSGRTWVLQALLIWQLLNRDAALDAGRDDPRFTRRFLVVAPGPVGYGRLLDAFCGRLRGGARAFPSSEIAAGAELFVPAAQRERVFEFVRGHVRAREEIGGAAAGDAGLIALADWQSLAGIAGPLPQAPLAPDRSAGGPAWLDRRRAQRELLEVLAGLPDLMVFNDEVPHLHVGRRAAETGEAAWRRSLSRIAAARGRRFAQVDFSALPYDDVVSGGRWSKRYFPHIIVDVELERA